MPWALVVYQYKPSRLTVEHYAPATRRFALGLAVTLARMGLSEDDALLLVLRGPGS